MESEPWDREDEDAATQRRSPARPAAAAGEDDLLDGDTVVSPRRSVPAVDPESLATEGDADDTVVSSRRPRAPQDDPDDDTVLSSRRAAADDADDATVLSASHPLRDADSRDGDDDIRPRSPRSGVEVPEDSSEIREATEPRASAAGTGGVTGRPATRPRVGRAEIPVDPSSPLGIERYQVRRGGAATTPPRHRYGSPATRQRTSVPEPPPLASAAAPPPRVRARVVALAVAGTVVAASALAWLVWF
ncbi:hypothetical protein [Rarobacter faecitabidus]|uniref:Uncharacterized protein n=1 Tax=Rarobacter faecitabidus TaxID=13243 RepID=A0A542ZTR7_RARFA|nr:hypothetical protein [Rarobacter faecitabidus]TQL63753.1 hypothetical protein FB461_0226 [Rarobacter faecitabidus]